MFLALEEYQIMAIIWIAFIIISGIIELMTVDLVIIWFTVGAIGGLIASLVKAPVYLQLIIFIVISFVLLLATRPLAKKMQQKEIIKTNADKIIGSYVIVTKEISKDFAGEIQYGDRFWRASTDDTETIKVGEKVLVEAISGAKVIVTKEKELNENKEIVL